MTGDRSADVIVIGSGFGGAVAALRLAEKGYAVTVLEAGRRFADDELPATSWRLRDYLWAPSLGCYGIQRLRVLPNTVIAAGAGVGGGSLNYANTLYQPSAEFFARGPWSGLTDWQDELAPHYDQARRMLGVVANPTSSAADLVMRRVAGSMGAEATVRPTQVGVFFGEPGRVVPDPFFGGAGPERTGCTSCGSCMTGCRVGAKNTLTKNYLPLAERAGARIVPMTTVVELRPAGTGFDVVTRPSDAKLGRGTTTWRAGQVVLAAGTWGTLELLLAMRDSGRLPDLSPMLGKLVRTNSEVLLAATARDRSTDYSRGVAISTSFHPSPDLHVENTRFGSGSNLMALMQTVLTDGGGRVPRLLRVAGRLLADPRAMLRSLSVRHWSERTVLALVMQTSDASLEVSARRGLLGRRLTSRHGPGEPAPSWIPGANEVARRIADQIGGDARGSWADVLGRPATGHFLGGCVIGPDPSTGVIDGYHRVHGYLGLHVTDGTAVSGNLGVNPSLTITAQAERACALWPNRGEADVRPAPGEAYRRIPPTPPRHPVVPAGSPGELRIPTIGADQR